MKKYEAIRLLEGLYSEASTWPEVVAIQMAIETMRITKYGIADMEPDKPYRVTKGNDDFAVGEIIYIDSMDDAIVGGNGRIQCGMEGLDAMTAGVEVEPATEFAAIRIKGALMVFRLEEMKTWHRPT